MDLQVPTSVLFDRNVRIFRISAVLLLVLAAALNGGLVDTRLIALIVGYVFVIGLATLLSHRLTSTPFIYTVLFLDISVVSAGIILMPATPFPLWLLYLFPLLSAASAGTAPGGMAAGVCLVEYLSSILIIGGTVPHLALWPLEVLIVWALGATTLAAQPFLDRQQKQTWREVAAATRALARSDQLGEVVAVIAERARHLVRAECACVWWLGDHGQLQFGAQAGHPVEQLGAFCKLTPSSLGKLGHGTIPLRDIGEPFVDAIGEVAALRHEGKLMALVAVIWPTSPRRRSDARERLRMFAAWAGDALAYAKAHATTAEELRWEKILSRAAADLAATLDSQEVYRIAVEAARSRLGAAVTLIEKPSGRVVAGELEVAESLVRLTLDYEILGGQPDARLSLMEPSVAPLITPIVDDLALIYWPMNRTFDKSAPQWMVDFAAIVRGALKRCASHTLMRTEVERVRASLDAMPVPFVICDEAGQTFLENMAHRDLGLEQTPVQESPSLEKREEEVTVGDPPREFSALTLPVGQWKDFVTVYRETTRERAALRAKDELIAIVGHELRTPLTSIYGYSQMMARQLGTVEQQVGQLNRIIGDFLDAAKLQGGHGSISRQTVDVADIARKAADRFHGAYETRELRLELSEVDTIDGDPGRLAQMLDNLLGNAVKYSPPEQEIELSVGMREKQVFISVRDYGVGIAPEHVPHLFDRFYRASEPEIASVRGLGLGLSIVRDIVAAHGGRVWAESAGAGLGSTFWVTLPSSNADKVLQPIDIKRAS